MTTDRVNATFQKEMLEFISDSLTEEERIGIRNHRTES